MAVLAIELALLRHADAAHQRLLECRRLAGMAGQADLAVDISRVDRSVRDCPAGDRAFFRSWRGLRAAALLQVLEQAVGLRQLRQIFGRLRLRRAEPLREVLQRGDRLVVKLLLGGLRVDLRGETVQRRDRVVLRLSLQGRLYSGDGQGAFGFYRMA